MSTAYMRSPPQQHRTSIPNMSDPPYNTPNGAYSNGHPMSLPQLTQASAAPMPPMSYSASNGYPNGQQMPSPHSAQSNGAYAGAPPPQNAYNGPPSQSNGAYNGAPPPQGNQGYTSNYSQYPPSAVQPELAQADGYQPLAATNRAPPHEPEPLIKIEDGKRYELRVMQQPRRARMCGFGDKDRRPITPPPCVRLIITDTKTGKEVDCNDIDHGMFVLSVDLWSADGSREVNLVRHSATSPSISLTTPVSYQEIGSSNVVYSDIMPQANILKFEPGPPPAASSYNAYPGPPQVNAHGSQVQQPYYQNGYAPASNSQNGAQQYQQQNGYSQQQQQNGYYQNGAAGPSSHVEYPPAPPVPSHQYDYASSEATPRAQQGSITNTSPSGMFTRNLIGSLTASAFRLTDPQDKIGIWFVLQDLSVRTEGNFRLRFSFVNIGVPVPPGHPQGGNISSMVPNTGRVPILACCFSEVFTVYSAKRFPGVVESTPLSKCFATQGIKIPIRKDGSGKGDKDKEFEDD